MKTLWKSFKITIAFCIFFSLFYILVLWIFAQFAGPNKGNAEVATLNGKVVGAANVGQMFTQDIYFWGRRTVQISTRQGYRTERKICKMQLLF
jgi:K+-transporting ATPase ATPase C chain